MKKTANEKLIKSKKYKKLLAKITLQPSYNAALAVKPYTNMLGNPNILDLTDELAVTARG